ncbi:4-aminobutyrate aminotransferase [Citrobacter youngae]|nr:4-aminobutyrate aminotransferase [Citrobacter youngae]
MLTDARAVCPELAEVRGLGSMIAAEFCDVATGEPSATAAQRVQKKALEQGLLLLTCGQYGNVIRFLYPLTIPQDQFAKALEIIKTSMK